MKQCLVQLFSALPYLVLFYFPGALTAGALQQKEYTAVSYASLANIAIALIIVLGVFFAIMHGCKHLLKRYTNNSAHLKIVDRINLGNRESLLMIRYPGHQHILLAVTPGNIRQIKAVPIIRAAPPEEEKSTPNIYG